MHAWHEPRSFPFAGNYHDQVLLRPQSGHRYAVVIDSVSMERAFASFGADSAGRRRPLSGVAEDGSLVLVCRSDGFTRPGVGVLRYTAQLSAETAAIPQVSKLRTQLTNALSAGTEVRLVIETLATERTAGRVHVRPDLPGKVATFDGDAYVVDFSRPPPPPPPPKNRRR
jgi:hypothetical protein